MITTDKVKRVDAISILPPSVDASVDGVGGSVEGVVSSKT